MGLWSFLFGPRYPGQGKLSASDQTAAEKPHPRYGRLAEREDLAKAVRRQRAEERAAEKAESREEEKPTSAYRVPGRYQRAARHLKERIRREHADLIGHWPRQTRGLERYVKTLGEAESRREAYGIFRRARGLSPPGRLRKLGRKLEGAKESLYRKYEAGGVSRPELMRKRASLERSFRDVRKLSRWR